MLVQPHCVSNPKIILKNCKQTAENANKFLKIEKNLPPLKRILALTTYIESEMHSFRVIARINGQF